MYKRLFQLIFVLVICAASAICAASTNLNKHEYTRWASPVNSYLYVDDENLIRVENDNGNIIVEKYSAELNRISAQILNGDFLSIWGGFFAGRDFNYIITGQANNAESDRNEVIRVSKYDKNWNFIANAKVFGANTNTPFDAASLRCAEHNGILYLRTGHKMYRTPDNLNHQANMTVAINTARMTVADISCDISYQSTGYVSHSFNQFIIVDSGRNIVTLDHGDAYPRAAILSRYRNKSGNGKFTGQTTDIELVNFKGSIGDNATGASIGGLAETTSHYVTVYNYDGVGGNPNDYFEVVNGRELFIAFTPKNKFSKSATKTVKLTLPDQNFRMGTPILAPVNLDGGYIFYNETKRSNGHFIPTGRIYWAHYDSNCNVTSSTAIEGKLSDCQPVIYNGKVIWYVTENSAPTFYTFDETGLTAHKSN